MSKDFFDAFISYGRPDSKEFAIKLHQRLQSEGYQVWLDQNDIPFGVNFPQEIKQGIARSDNFIFIISPHAVHSPYCNEEIDYAVQYNKRILPLLQVEAINQQTWQKRNPMGTDQDWEQYCSQGKHSSFTRMRPEISKVNWIYCREEIDDFEAAITALLEIFQRHQQYVYQHTKLLDKALQWEKQQKQVQYLLIGQERLDATNWLKTKFTHQQPPCYPTDLHCEFISESEKNANNNMAKVFMSYLSKDRPIMEKIGRTLRRNSLTIWTTATDGKTAENLHYETLPGIEKSDSFLYFVSQEILNSNPEKELCQQELNYALSLNKKVLLLLIDPIDFGSLSSIISETQIIDFTENQDEQKYQESIDKLIRILEEQSDYHQQHTLLLVKALLWQQQNQYPSLLLRGKSLEQAKLWLQIANKRSRYGSTSLQENYILTSSLQLFINYYFDVFISYSDCDLDFANRLNNALEIQGKIPYFEPTNLEHSEIEEAINRSDNFILIISPDSTNIDNRRYQIDYAQNLNKRIFLVLYCFNQDQEIPIQVKDNIYFSRNEANFSSKFNELIRDLDTDRDHVHSHTKWSGQALEWKNSNHLEDYLLRGNELIIAQTWLEDADNNDKEPSATDLQRAFIGESQELRDRLQYQEELNRRQKLQQARRISLAAVIAGVILAISTTFSLVKLREAQINQIETLLASSEADLDSGQAFDALLKSLQAKQKYRENWTKWLTGVLPITKLPDQLSDEIFDTLRQATNNVRERRITIEKQSGLSTFAFSGDDKTLATGSQEGTVKLYRRQGDSFEPLEAQPIPYGEKIMSLSFSPDGKLLAIAAWRTAVRIWDLEKQQYVMTLPYDAWVNRLSFSPDGEMLATASANGQITLWGLNKNKSTEIEQLSYFSVKGSAIALNFSQDGQYLGVGTNQGEVVVRNRQGQTLSQFTTKSAINDLQFSPDGQLLAVATNGGLGQVWRWQKEEKISQLVGHENRINAMTFSPNGQQIATASEDTTIRLWDLQGNLLEKFPGHKQGATQIKYMANSPYLVASATDGMLHLWDLSWKDLPKLKGHINSVYRVQFSPDGQYLATGSADETARLWSLQGEQLAVFPHGGVVTSVSFNPNSKLLLTGASDGIARVWNLKNYTPQSPVLEGYSDDFFRVSFNPKQSYWVAGASYGEIKGYNSKKNQFKHQTSSQVITDLSFSSDGQLLATASFDEGVAIWNTKQLWGNSGKIQPNLKLSYPRATSMGFSSQNQMLAIGSVDGQVSIWNNQGQQVRNWQAHQDSILSLNFSADGQYLATGSWDGTARLWNIQGEKLAQFTSHAGPVFSVAFSPNNKCLSQVLNPKVQGYCLATTSSDGTVYLWRVESEKELLQRACKWVYDVEKNCRLTMDN